jgi:endoglucanase
MLRGIYFGAVASFVLACDGGDGTARRTAPEAGASITMPDGGSGGSGGSAANGPGGRTAGTGAVASAGRAASGGAPSGSDASAGEDGSAAGGATPDGGAGTSGAGVAQGGGAAAGGGGKGGASGGCGTGGAVGANPFSGARFYVDPDSKAKQQADTWRSSRPADAAQIDKIAKSSWSRWLGDFSGDITAAARKEVDTITAACALPVLVAYNIPHRDCGGQSGGGAGTAEAYRAWIRGMASGIGGRRAVVILEPDALALQCSDAAGNQERYSLLTDAVNVLTASGSVSVYIDAGHSDWIAPADMAGRLRSGGVAKARGFAVNVSNFRTTADEITYGNAIVQALGSGKKFIVDTSRNGLGYNGEWCNPAGRALGVRATASTNNANVDAFYWIKTVGLSDGECNGGPAAGTWWPEYALGLAQRAAY